MSASGLEVENGPENLLVSSAGRVAIEIGWLPALSDAQLNVFHLEPDGFTCVDPGAGYWTSPSRVRVIHVRQVNDCVAALAGRDVELRLVASLWPYVDAVVAAPVEFSVIRIRNAVPRS